MARIISTILVVFTVTCLSLQPVSVEASQRPDIAQAMRIAHDHGVIEGYTLLKQRAAEGRATDIELFLTYANLYAQEIYKARPGDKDWDRAPWLEDSLSGFACLNPNETMIYKKGVIQTLVSNRVEKYKTVKACLVEQGIDDHSALKDDRADAAYGACKVKSVVPTCFASGK